MMKRRKLIETEVEGRKLILYENPQGDRELFVDGIHGMSISPQTVKFNFYTASPWGGDNEKEEYREVVARVVMTLPTFVAIAQFMSSRLEELLKAGLISMDDSQKGGGG